MTENAWNPVVKNVAIFEKPLNTKPVRAYDFRLFFILSGGVALEAEGEKKLKLSPGNFCLIPPGLSYRLKGEYCKLFTVAFDLSGENAEPIPAVPADEFDAEKIGTADLSPFDHFVFVEDMNAERDGFLEMHKIFLSAAGKYRARLSAMLKLFLIHLAEMTDEDALPPRLVEALDAYIRENAADDLTNTEVGAIFGYHPFYISQMLKKKMGITLKQYIIAYKLRTAYDMLHYTKKTTAEIAEETGFTDASYFTKSFKATYGMTPKEYRNTVADETP